MNNILGLKNLLEKDKLGKIPEDKLKAYEKSLNDRKMPKYLLNDDPYGIGLYEKKMDRLIAKDEKTGEILYEANGKMKVVDILREESPDRH